MSPEEPLDDQEELLFKLLCAIDEGADAEQLLAQHPEHAECLRRRLGHLKAVRLEKASSWSPPETIGPYRLIEPLGSGGMGDVWRAVAGEGKPQVALKFVRSSALVPNQMRRFAREAAALQRLNHPGIVGIQDVGEADGFRYIAMDLLEGKSLEQTLKDEPPSLDLVVAWGLELALALSAAHAKGVVHRDVKPSNIQVTPDGHPVLLDFGLTRELGPSSLSVTGKFVGSPHYSPPEQIQGMHDVIGPAADVYALGATLYQALSGHLPFDGKSTEQIFHRILTEDPVPLRKHVPSIPRDLENVIQCALEKRTEDRYRTADRFAADLGAVIASRPVLAKAHGPMRRLRAWSRRHPGWSTAAVVAVLASLATASSVGFTNYQERLGRERSAVLKLEEAREVFEDFVQAAVALPKQVSRFASTLPMLDARPYSAQATAEANRLQLEIEQSEALSEQAYTQILELLRQAEELDPSLQAAGWLRAQLHYQRWELARASNNRLMMDFFAERVREYDSEGELAQAVQPMRQVLIRTNPPDARVDAFVFRRQDRFIKDGEPRLIPVAYSGPAQVVTPGAEVLKVFSSPPPLMAEDILLEVAGFPIAGTVLLRWPEGAALRQLITINGHTVNNVGMAEDLLMGINEAELLLVLRRDSVDETVRVQVADMPTLLSPLQVAELGNCTALLWRNEEQTKVIVPEQAILRPTSAPLLHDDRSNLGQTPLHAVTVPGERVLLLVRAEGYVPARRLLVENEEEVFLELDPVGSFPAPFRRFYTESDSVLAMDREVSCAEYAEFLNAVPDQALPMDWTRNSSGQAIMPPSLGGTFPMQAVSWNEVQNYLQWRNQQAVADGNNYQFELPEYGRWQALLHCGDRQQLYAWGMHYRNHFAKTCFSRATPRPEPALRFSIDETMLGLHDTAGGVSELCDGWFWQERQQRPVYGGSWVYGERDRFAMRSVWGSESSGIHEHVGFRLILREGD